MHLGDRLRSKSDQTMRKFIDLRGLKNARDMNRLSSLLFNGVYYAG